MTGDLPPPRILLVEGPTDLHVVEHLRRRHENMPAFKVVAKEGIEKLKSDIELEFNVSGREALGILVDANDDPGARWGEIADQLAKVGVKVPHTMKECGFVAPVRPRVGIWLMPDNRSPGELEHFIKHLIPDSDPVWPLAVRYIQGIPTKERKFKSHKELRAQIHAWLATRANPRLMGSAIGARDFNASAPLAVCFIDWLRRVFEPSEADRSLTAEG